MAEDPDRMPILFTEEFRRAKRNALVWAAATLLVSLGHIQGGGTEAEVDTVIGKFVFAPTLLAGMSLLVLGFMFAGYLRAEGRLLARHSEFELAERVGGEADLATRIHDQLDRAGLVATELIESSGAYREELKRYVDSVTSWANEIPVESETCVEAVDPNTCAHSQFSSEEETSRLSYQEIIYRTEEAVRLGVRAAAQYRNGNLKAVQGGHSPPPKPNPDLVSVSAEFQRQLERTARLSSDITNLASTIGQGERNWFKWHDRLPVLASCGVAALAAIIRLWTEIGGPALSWFGGPYFMWG